MSLFFILAAIFVVFAGCSKTVESAGEGPELVAAEAMAAMQEGRIMDFAELMHPEALLELRESISIAVDAAEKAGESEDILLMFPDIGSLNELRALDDVGFFAAFFEAVLESMPSVGNALAGMEIEVVGQVSEGTDVHVLYRGTIDVADASISKLSVMSLRNSDQGWRMLLTGVLEGMASILRRQYESAE